MPGGSPTRSGWQQRQRLALTVLNGTLCFSLAGGLLFASHLVAVNRDFIASVFASDEVTDAHARPLQRPAARRRRRPDADGDPARQHHGRQHRRGDRPHGPDRAAAQHGRRAFPEDSPDARRVPRRIRLRGLLPQRRQHLRHRPQGPLSRREEARHRGDQGGRRGDHRSQHQLLRADRPQGFLRPGRRGRRGDDQRPGAHPDRWRRRTRSPTGSSRANKHLNGYQTLWYARSRRPPTTTRGWRGRSA